MADLGNLKINNNDSFDVYFDLSPNPTTERLNTTMHNEWNKDVNTLNMQLHNL